MMWAIRVVGAYGGGGARMRIWGGGGVCSDAARRVVIKIIGPHRWVACGVHGMRMAAAMGRHLDRNGILATPDCRGGVFAVFAKISPPVAHPPSPPRASPCPPLPRPLPINGWRGCVCSDVACRVAVIIIPHRDF